MTQTHHHIELWRKYMEAVCNSAGEELAAKLPKFYGKVTLNFYNGKYVNANIEASIHGNNPRETMGNRRGGQHSHRG